MGLIFQKRGMSPSFILLAANSFHTYINFSAHIHLFLFSQKNKKKLKDKNALLLKNLISLTSCITSSHTHFSHTHKVTQHMQRRGGHKKEKRRERQSYNSSSNLLAATTDLVREEGSLKHHQMQVTIRSTYFFSMFCIDYGTIGSVIEN